MDKEKDEMRGDEQNQPAQNGERGERGSVIPYEIAMLVRWRGSHLSNAELSKDM